MKKNIDNPKDIKEDNPNNTNKMRHTLAKCLQLKFKIKIIKKKISIKNHYANNIVYYSQKIKLYNQFFPKPKSAS